MPAPIRARALSAMNRLARQIPAWVDQLARRAHICLIPVEVAIYPALIEFSYAEVIEVQIRQDGDLTRGLESLTLPPSQHDRLYKEYRQLDTLPYR